MLFAISNDFPDTDTRYAKEDTSSTSEDLMIKSGYFGFNRYFGFNDIKTIHNIKN